MVRLRLPDADVAREGTGRVQELVRALRDGRVWASEGGVDGFKRDRTLAIPLG